MKSIVVSLFERAIKYFCLLTIFWLLSVSVNAITPVFVKNYKVSVTARRIVNGQDVPVPGAQVLVRINSRLNNVSMYEFTSVITTDNNGYFETILPCYRDSSPNPATPGYNGSAQAIGTNGGGQGGGGGNSNCNATNEFILTLRPIVSSTEPDFQNAGESCSVGEPVNMTNGNMWLRQNDYALPGIEEGIKINRYYNTVSQQTGVFGFGWQSDYDQSIYNHSNIYLRLISGTGRGFYFAGIGNNVFVSASAGFYGQITRNGDNTYTLTFKDGRVHQFSSTGKLLWQRDRNGNQTTLTYNVNGNLTGITDAFNRTLTLTPNANGTIAQINDSIGTVATYEYFPGTTLLKSVTYADGSKYKYEYTNIVIGGQTKTFLTTVKDALDNVLETHQYDANGRATTSEKHGGVEKYTLDYAHINDALPYTTVTDALGRTTKYWFDKSKGRNVITKTEGNCNCGSGSQTTVYEYDDRLNLIKKVDALLNQTVYTYDGNGNRLSMTNVLGTETYTYNAFGEILTRTDRMNGVTTNTFDAAGNLLTTKDALNNTTTLTYKPNGLPETIKDARNNTTVLTYDASGRLTQVKDANLKTTVYTYDARSRLLTMKNALNYTTTLEYDLNNRVKKVTYPDLKFVEYGYDTAGRRISTKDERGNITTYGYDAAYRLISVTDPLTHTSGYGYDLMSNRTSTTDALGNTTDYEYDEFNRLKKIIYPPSTVGATRLEERIEYDAVGNVKKRIDTANRETVYDYDTANRLVKTIDADLKETQFEYNARSQMTAVVDALTQRYDFTYDALGRQLSQTRAGSVMSYEYDAVGNRTKRTDYLSQITNYTYDNLNRLTAINYPDTTENIALTYDALSRLTKATKNLQDVTFVFDKRNRMTSTTDVFSKITAMTYDAAGNRTALKLDGVNFSTYAYDVANRLTRITNSADAKAVSYLYDNADRMTKETLPNGIATTFAYDGMSRLTRLKDAKGTATLFDRQLSYNPANQISQILEPTQTRNFNYDAVDRLTSVSGSTVESYNFDAVGNRTNSHLSASYSYQPFNRLTNTATANYVYNSNGNITQKTDGNGTTQYVWDYENRLKQVILPTGQMVNYKYDALGRRIERNINGASWTRFTYDGLDVMLDQNSDGTSVTYLNGAGIDNKLRQTVNGQAQYFTNDHLGSTNALTDATGAVIASTNYDSFGNATNTSFPTRYQYTGREFDNFTGLHYYRARWYDANLGRFISEDPIGFAGGDVNLFAYVKNKPINRKDPRGLDDADREWEERFNPRSPDRNAWYWSNNESADNQCDRKPKCNNSSSTENFTCLPCDFYQVKGFSAHSQGGQAQKRNFPNGGPDPYSGGYRHCVGACILTKRYGPVGQIGRKYWDFMNEDSTGFWNQLGYEPNSDNHQDRQAEDIGERLGYTSCETCENSCLSQYPPFNIYDSDRGK